MKVSFDFDGCLSQPVMQQVFLAMAHYREYNGKLHQLQNEVYIITKRNANGKNDDLYEVCRP
jgi:hypothetical protein